MKNVTKSIGLSALILFSWGYETNALAQSVPPKEVINHYSTEINMEVSDDFNTPLEWDTKWTHRRGHGGRDQICLTQDEKDPENKYLCVKAVGSTSTGAGLSSLKSSKYGFYILKWRTKGIEYGVTNNWHPSTWAACDNFGDSTRYIVPDKRMPHPYQRLELDPMEGYGTPKWGSHFIAWTGGNMRSYHLRTADWVWPKDGEWSIIGMEYTPDYIAGWEFVDGKWKFLKKMVFNNERNTSETSLYYRHRQRVYWIHSNIHINFNAPATDSEYQVDYFYHFPYKYNEAMLTDGINYAMVEGTSDEVKVTAKMGGYKDRVVVPETVDINGKTYRVTAIDEEAFRDCEALNEVVLPAGLKSIGYAAFDGSGVVLNAPEGLVYIDNYLVGCKGLWPTDVKVKEGTTLLADGVFGNWTELLSVELPQSLKSIPYGAFDNCLKLNNITFADDLKTIGAFAFKDCHALKNIPASRALKTIGDRAFDGCAVLEAITLAPTITSIGERAFHLCSQLKNVYMTGETAPKMISDFSKAEFPKDAILNVPTGSKENYKSNAYWNNFASILDPMDAVKDVQTKAKNELQAIHAKVELFENTKYVGHLKNDDTPKYNEMIAAVDAIKATNGKDALAEVQVIIENYKKFLAVNAYMPQEGKYYTIESTGYYNSKDIKVYELMDGLDSFHPAWKAAATFDPDMMWEVEYAENGLYNFKSPNSGLYISDYWWGHSSTMETGKEKAVKFELYKTDDPCVFQLLGTQVVGKPGKRTFFSAAISDDDYTTDRNATSGDYISAFMGDIDARPNGWKIREVDAVPVAVDEAKFVTRNFPFPLDLSTVKDAKIYLVKSQDGTKAYLEEFKGRYLPALTAFVLYSETPQVVNLPICYEFSFPKLEGNIMQGTTTEMITTWYHKKEWFYILSTDDTGLNAAFYRLSPANYENRIRNNRGYLRFPKAAATGAETLSLDFGEVTGIDGVKDDPVLANTWYTVGGVKVEKPTKGIYVNGNGNVVLFK